MGFHYKQLLIRQVMKEINAMIFQMNIIDRTLIGIFLVAGPILF